MTIYRKFRLVPGNMGVQGNKGGLEGDWQVWTSELTATFPRPDVINEEMTASDLDKWSDIGAVASGLQSHNGWIYQMIPLRTFRRAKRTGKLPQLRTRIRNLKSYCASL